MLAKSDIKNTSPLFKSKLKLSTYGKRYSKSIFAPPLEFSPKAKPNNKEKQHSE